MIEIVKGFRDIFPPQSSKRKKIREIVEKNMELFGFMPIETPTIEYEEVLKGDNENDEAVSDRFRLKDRGGRELGLRYEFTFQLSRIFKENPNIKLPFKRYQVGGIFRDEALRPGKYKEFIQADADIIGDSSHKADAECIALADKILKDLKIKADIKINNRKIINEILERSYVIKNKQQVLREIDKLDKLSEKEVKVNLKKFISDESIKKIFGFIKNNFNYFVKNNFNGIDEIKQVIDLGKYYGFKVVFSPILMRGFSYYTGNIFEIWTKGKNMALAGGGRYDDKIGKYIDKKIPAVGISFGTLFDLEDVELDNKKVLIISLNQDKKAVLLADKIRNFGISCSIFYGKPTKALDYANSYNIPLVIFIGEEEVKKKKFKIKNMASGKEKLISEKSLKNLLKI